MTDCFLKTIRRLARQEARGLPPSARCSFAHSFQVACAKRLAWRIWKRKYATEIDSIPLYRREEEANQALLAALGIRLVYGTGPGTRITDILGEAAGRSAADTIGLDPQLPSGRAPAGPAPQAPPERQMDLPMG